MKKKLLVLFMICVFQLWACDVTKTEDEPVEQNNTITIVNDVNEVVETSRETMPEEMPSHRFLAGEAALEILAADDDYTIKLSKFDYASKFLSSEALDQAGRRKALGSHVLDWSDTQMGVIDEAMANIMPKLDVLNIEMPTIDFILTTENDEGGAAYTRANAIVLKPYYMGSSSSENLERLIVHEMFHVYSRAHKEDRSKFYGVIQYFPCEELVIPKELVDFTIANPDAPDNNFYIEGIYEGETYAFIPLIYSSAPYNIEKGGSFFETLNDDMLAVEFIDGVPHGLYKDDVLLILKKSQVEGYLDKIGHNTNYTYHPEETIADNFVLLVFGDTVPSQWVVDGLKKALEN